MSYIVHFITRKKIIGVLSKVSNKKKFGVEYALDHFMKYLKYLLEPVLKQKRGKHCLAYDVYYYFGHL